MSSWKDDVEDDDDEENEDDYKSSEDRIIFLIDARSNMFEKNKTGEIHFENCVKMALAVMKSKIVASDKSSIGIIFFGTEKSNSTSASQGVYTLFSLDPPTASRIRELQESIDDISIFHKKIGSMPSSVAGVASYCPLNEAFWACSGAFSVKSQSHKQNDFRRIWLFTNDDNPNGNDQADQGRVIQASRDCSESGIELSLWHINRTSAPFDPSKFYTKLLTMLDSSDGDDGNEGIEDHIENRMRGAGYDGFDMMMANVRRKQHRKRKLGSLMFSLGGSEEGSAECSEVQIAIQMYKTVSITTRPTYAWLFRGTNEPLKSNSRMYNGQTGATLDDSQIQTFIPINESTRIPFTSDDMSAIKQSRGTGLKLLFFTPLSNITPELNLSTPYFLFPDEKRVLGSSALFASLVEDLAGKNLAGIVRFTRSAASMPRIAAMIPQRETVDNDGIQINPMGMHLVQLPFDEEISLKHCAGNAQRHSSDSAVGSAESAVSNAALNMVNALTIDTVPYNSIDTSTNYTVGEGEGDNGGERREGGGEKICYYRDMGNPALQRFYSVLQAIALMENLPSDQTQRDQDLLKPYFCLEPTQEDDDEEGGERGGGGGKGREGGGGGGGGSSSFEAVVRKRAILKFKEVVGLTDDDVALSECPKSKKRPTPGAGGGGGGVEKKQKADCAEHVPKWKSMVADDQMKSLTIPALKEICSALGVPVSGVKKALLDRITAALADI